jgi:hypothetical protein
LAKVVRGRWPIGLAAALTDVVKRTAGREKISRMPPTAISLLVGALNSRRTFEITAGDFAFAAGHHLTAGARWHAWAKTVRPSSAM